MNHNIIDENTSLVCYGPGYNMWRPVGMLWAWVLARPYIRLVWVLIPGLIPELIPWSTPIYLCTTLVATNVVQFFLFKRIFHLDFDILKLFGGFAGGVWAWFLKILNLLVSFLAHFFKSKNFGAQFRNQVKVHIHITLSNATDLISIKFYKKLKQRFI
jgi:hypothetical protein